MSGHPTCPRCLHHIPNDVQPGVHRGGVSRVADVEVCSACSCHEAMLQFTGREVPTTAEWPIGAPWQITTPLTWVKVMRSLGLDVSFAHALRATTSLDGAPPLRRDDARPQLE